MTVLHYGRRGQTLARTLVADIASLVPKNKYSNINYLLSMAAPAGRQDPPAGR
jgi:hypothetical protein